MGNSQFVCDNQKQFWLFSSLYVRLGHSFLQIKALCNNVKYWEMSLTHNKENKKNSLGLSHTWQGNHPRGKSTGNLICPIDPVIYVLGLCC